MRPLEPSIPFRVCHPGGAAYRCKKQTAMNKLLDAVDKCGPAMAHTETCPDSLAPSRDSLPYALAMGWQALRNHFGETSGAFNNFSGVPNPGGHRIFGQKLLVRNS